MVRSPGGSGWVGMMGRGCGEKSDHAEFSCLAKRRLASDVRIGIVLRALNAEAMARLFGVRVTHRAFFTRGSRSRAALFVVGVGFGALLGVFLLLLAVGGGVEVLLDQGLRIAGRARVGGPAH